MKVGSVVKVKKSHFENLFVSTNKIPRSRCAVIVSRHPAAIVSGDYTVFGIVFKDDINSRQAKNKSWFTISEEYLELIWESIYD